MPDFIPADVAEAAVTALNEVPAGTFSQEFEAIRSYADWELPLEDSAPGDRVFVDVVPVPDSGMELETRGSVVFMAPVDIIIRLRLGPERRGQNGKFQLHEIDALGLFVQEVALFFVMRVLGSGSNVAIRNEEDQPIRRWFVPQHLHRYHQFTAMLRVPFWRSKAL